LSSSPKKDGDDAMERILRAPQPAAVGWRQLLEVIKCQAWFRLKSFYFWKLELVLELIGISVNVLTFYFISILGGEALNVSLQPYGESYVAFYAVGMAIHYTIDTSGLRKPAKEFQRLYWKGEVETWLVAPAPFWTFFIASQVFGLIRMSLPILGWLVFGILLGGNIAPSPNIGMIILLILFGLVATTGYGILATSTFYFLEAKTGEVPLLFVTNLLIYPVTGLVFPFMILPRWLQVIGLTLPQTYVYDGFRRALLNPNNYSPTLPIHNILPFHPILTDLLCTVPLSLLLLWFGWWAFKRSVNYAKRNGTLTRWV